MNTILNFLTKYWYIPGAIILIFLLIWLINSMRESESKEDIKQSRTKENEESIDWPLQRGMINNKVKQLQKWLNEKADPQIKEDGIFGPNTETKLNAVVGREFINKSEFNERIG